MIISLQNGQFKVYAPDLGEGRSASVPIAGDDAYIVVMKSLAEVTFTGTAWDGNISLNEGLNLLAVPVNPGQMTLRDLARKLGSSASSIFWYNPATGRFTEYQPTAAAYGNRQIRVGEGYIVSMTAPAIVTFSGEAWTNESASSAAPSALVNANRTATPLFIVEGTVLQKDTGQPIDDITVTVKNLKTGSITTVVTTSIVSSPIMRTTEVVTTGQYRALLTDLTGNRAAQVGDILEVTAHTPTGSLQAEPLN